MTRNWDTIREILTKIEKRKLSEDPIRLDSFPLERGAEIFYHMTLLIEAGLVHGQVSDTIGLSHGNFYAERLTWEGHEFLDAIRSDTIWQRTKKTFTEKGVDMTFDLVKVIAKETAVNLMKAALGG